MKDVEEVLKADLAHRTRKAIPLLKELRRNIRAVSRGSHLGPDFSRISSRTGKSMSDSSETQFEMIDSHGGCRITVQLQSQAAGEG